MTFAREKRLWLGVLALLAPLPLPWNAVVSWPVLLLSLGASALFLREAWRGRERWLPNWALNALGLAYLPVLVVDALVSGRVQPVRPVVHLILFGLAAKLFSLRRERDKWHAVFGAFFLFLAAMATSVHPSVVLYLVAFLGVAMATLVRFAFLHLLASFGHRELPAAPMPVARFLVAAALGTLLVAVPLFAILPRVRTPLVVAPSGFGEFRESGVGFSDEMSLDLIGRNRDNRAVALRLQLSGHSPIPDTLRLKAATYEEWQGRSWRRSRRAPGPGRVPERGLGFRLAPGRPVGEAQVFLEPIGSTGLPLPVETMAIDAEVPIVELDAGGAVVLRAPPTRQVEYKALLGALPVSAAIRPRPETNDPTLDRAGITSEMEQLAATWAGGGSTKEQADRIEARFHRELRYSTAFVGRGGADPIGDFLFRSREGHCEYFASAMVLLLRARGIPARLATGFYGAEASFWESSFIVRQSSAHAWVEAWVGDSWTIFDPTPPTGRPSGASEDLWLYVRQAYDGLLFQWDRYVIGFDFDDQVGLIGRLRAYWDRLLEELRRADRQVPPIETPKPVEPVPAPRLVAESGRSALLAAGALALLASGVVFWVGWRRRAAWSATQAYLRLRERLCAAGMRLPVSLAPLSLSEVAAARFPEAAEPLAELVNLYVRESFSGFLPEAAELERTRIRLAAVERVLAVHRRRSRRRKS